MPANVSYEYENAEKEYNEAEGIPAKLKALQKMLSTAPSHKGGENLRKDIKQRISKYKDLLAKEKKASKKGSSLSIKKEGAARVVLIGKTNTGKSYLLSKITNAKPEIAGYEFTTKKPEMGTMNYEGVIIQVIEIPSITKDFIETEKGPTYLGIIREADLIVILSDSLEDEKFVKNELKEGGVKFNGLVVSSRNDISETKQNIWDKLGLIYVFTKSPGKKKDFPPVALEKGSRIKDLAGKVHKDFVRRFNYAKITGKSAKFENQQVGISHKLKTGDIVELHLK